MSGKETLTSRRLKELAAMLIIGDGLLAAAEPRRHMLLWQQGPNPWRKMMRSFVKRPGVTRLFGALELGLGLWLASRQKA